MRFVRMVSKEAGACCFPMVNGTGGCWGLGGKTSMRFVRMVSKEAHAGVLSFLLFFFSFFW